MQFSLRLDAAPIHDSEEELALTFLEHIGYIERPTYLMDVRRGPAYTIFVKCMLERPQKSWSLAELREACGASAVAVQRYLNKLRSLDILAEHRRGREKLYHLKHHSITKAWLVVEANARAVLADYAETVEHLASQLGEGDYDPEAKLTRCRFQMMLRERAEGRHEDAHTELENLMVRMGYTVNRGEGMRILECFIKRPDRFWRIEDIAVQLEISPLTVRKYISRLENLGLMEEKHLYGKRHLRLRRGSVRRGYEVAAAHAEQVLLRYREYAAALEVR